VVIFAFVSPIYLTIVNAFKTEDAIINDPTAPPILRLPITSSMLLKRHGGIRGGRRRVSRVDVCPDGRFALDQ